MNHEEQIRQLLEKYERHACNEDEIRQLHEWLEGTSLTGKAWEFGEPSERADMKNKMLSAISAGIESKRIAEEIKVTEGIKVSESIKVTGGIEVTEGMQVTAGKQLPDRMPLTETESIGQKGSIRSLRRSNTIMIWSRYAAAAAAMFLLVWGYAIIARMKGASREVVASSAPGKIEKIILPDGSTAWLNDNTELVYHHDFATNRHIELRRGEAFFEVKKDPGHVFRVSSGDLSTTVLGTSFSARMTGATGDLKVSVVTGKVMVSRPRDTLGYLLPGQRLKYDRNSDKISIDTALAGEADGWIHGDVFLQNATLQEVIQWLQDHYKLNIQNKRTTYQGEYYLQAKSDIPLPEVLKILNLLGKKNQVTFSLQEQTLTIQ